MRSKVKVKGHQIWYATHRLYMIYLHTKYWSPMSRDKKVVARTRNKLKKTIIWPWGQRSRSKVTKFGTRHIVYIWSTYIPNIKVLCQETKKLWPGQEISLKKQLFDLEVKGQGQRSPNLVRDTSSIYDLPTYQILKSYVKRQKSYGPDKVSLRRTRTRTRTRTRRRNF